MSVLEALQIGLMEAMSPQVLPFLLGGALFGLVLGMVPGLSGHFALAMTIPFLYGLSPPAGIALLLASRSTVAQGGGVTAILFSTPGSGQNAATLLDGPAMRDKGQAGLACGAALTSCFLGALFGVAVLALLLPVLQYVVEFMGPAEISMLVLLALTFVSVLGRGDMLRSVIAGLAGLFLATVGVDHLTNHERFTFGLLSLRDGLPMVPFILGIFAVSEMIDMWSDPGRAADSKRHSLSAGDVQRQIFRGALAVFRKWWLVLRCSSIGTAMGLIPGLGSVAASFVAYGHARATSKSASSFGSGNIEGVIGPESANDAVEGGALASTIAFGIPGSSSMAIVLAGLMVLGLHAGPEIITDHTDLVFVMVFTVVLGNLLGSAVGMFLVNPLSRLSTLSPRLLVPVLVPLIITGAYAVNRSVFDIGVVLVSGVIGYLMKRLGYARSTLMIGFILGSALEVNFSLALQLDGPLFFTQPAPLALLVVTLVFLTYNLGLFTRRSRHGESQDTTTTKPGGSGAAGERLPGLEPVLIGLLLPLLLLALLVALQRGPGQAITPAAILAPLVVLCAWQFRRCRAQLRSVPLTTRGLRAAWDQAPALAEAARFAAWIGMLLLLILVAGHYGAVAAFTCYLLMRTHERDWSFALATAGCVTLGLYLIFEIALDIELYRGLMVRALQGFSWA